MIRLRPTLKAALACLQLSVLLGTRDAMAFGVHRACHNELWSLSATHFVSAHVEGLPGWCSNSRKLFENGMSARHKS